MKSKLDREILAEIEGYDVTYLRSSGYNVHQLKHKKDVILSAHSKPELLKLIKLMKSLMNLKENDYEKACLG